jgi:hypothetical protein
VLATAALDARAARRVTAAAIAAALQGVLYWLIVHEAVGPAALPTSTPLEITILQTARRLRPATIPRKRRQRVPQRQTVLRKKVPAAKAAPHAPVDWPQAVEAEVRAAEARSRGPHIVRFGFPQEPAPTPTAPAFGWDYAHTHRIVPLPHGGMIINLSDHCFINVWVPIALCLLGKLPVNGHLFDHLHDPRDPHEDELP